VDPLPCWSVQIKYKLHKFFKRVHILEYTNVGVYKSITNQIQIKCDNRNTHQARHEWIRFHAGVYKSNSNQKFKVQEKTLSVQTVHKRKPCLCKLCKGETALTCYSTGQSAQLQSYPHWSERAQRYFISIRNRPRLRIIWLGTLLCFIAHLMLV